MYNHRTSIANQEGHFPNEGESLKERVLKLDGNEAESTLAEKQNSCGQQVKDKTDIVTDKIVHQSDEDVFIGDRDEIDLHKCIKGCTKNPDHKDFIPVKSFSLEHLPEDYRDNDLYELIKVVADLTVRVDVRMISPNRPEFWPNLTDPYPLFNLKNKRNLRTGTGRIEVMRQFVYGINENNFKPWKNSRNCWCKNCEASDSPSNVWWEFFVITATHVVFDDLEANQTSLRLFYDCDDSPKVFIDTVCIARVKIDNDKCVLKCVTCDKDLGNKLKERFIYYLDLNAQIIGKYHKSKDEHKLNFIVSYPHGCSKQVSVGQWKDKKKLGDSGFNVYNHEFTYTTCTCPGSSGANVHCVGYVTGLSSSSIVHRGSLKSGLNHSGFCMPK